MSKPSTSRREFVKKAAYVAPAILSLQAYSSLAKAGSVKNDRDDTNGTIVQSPKPKRPKIKKKD